MARASRRSAAGGLGLLRTVERSGLRKGMSGSKGWFYVGTGLWTLRTVRRLAERKEEILISEKLEPGQRIVISNGRATLDGPAPDPMAPRGRRARRRAEKATAKATATATKKAAKRAAKRSASHD